MTALHEHSPVPPAARFRTADPIPPVFGDSRLTPDDLSQIAHAGGSVSVSQRVADRLASARSIIDDAIARDEPSYGVNRGLGPLRDQAIPVSLQHDFQRFVFASHDAAVGPLLNRAEARAVILARLAVMARGNSGASQAVFDGLRRLIEADLTPAIPGEGSVGSADLASLAAVGAVLVGEGRILTVDGGSLPAAEALAAAGIAPIQLEAKDAHSLVVANAVSVGIGSLVSARLSRFAAAADLTAAATVEAVDANVSVFDDRLMRARPHPGQIRSAERMRAILAGSDLAEGRVSAPSLQDPLSIRTIPQVHGTLLEQLDQLTEVLTVELNSMPENPYLDRAENRMISNGNFSSIRLALALDSTRLMLAHTAMLAERRVALMIGRLRSGRSLVEQITSFDATGQPLVPVILANTASGLLARIQQLAAPITLLGASVGDGVEDHNAHATNAVRLLSQSLDLAEQLLAIETMVSSGLAALRTDPNPRRLSPVLDRLRSGALDVLGQRDPGHTTNRRVDQVSALLLGLADTQNLVFRATDAPID